jgi:hypothetical protein
MSKEGIAKNMVITAYNTDIGIKKSVNQDSLIIKKAIAGAGEVVLIGVCDGMGGLEQGELASAEAIKTLNFWFEQDLPNLLLEGLSNKAFVDSMTFAIKEANDRVYKYSSAKNIQCGTTLTAVLLYNGHYATVNVGDSRVYKIDNSGTIERLTHDQSVVQDKIDKGEITEEEARTHKARNVLLQCIGLGDAVTPGFSFGNYSDGDIFFACSDGFRHRLMEEEMAKLYNPKDVVGQEELMERAAYGVKLNMERGETDNITVALCQWKEESKKEG